LDILEAPSLEENPPERKSCQPEAYGAGKTAENRTEKREEKEKTEKEEKRENGKKEPKEEAASPMIEKLEKSLEETISTLPPGQLSEEQKKLFAYFTSVRGMNRQLAELLEEDRMRK